MCVCVFSRGLVFGLWSACASVGNIFGNFEVRSVTCWTDHSNVYSKLHNKWYPIHSPARPRLVCLFLCLFVWLFVGILCLLFYAQAAAVLDYGFEVSITVASEPIVHNLATQVEKARNVDYHLGMLMAIQCIGELFRSSFTLIPNQVETFLPLQFWKWDGYPTQITTLPCLEFLLCSYWKTLPSCPSFFPIAVCYDAPVCSALRHGYHSLLLSHSFTCGSWYDFTTCAQFSASNSFPVSLLMHGKWMVYHNLSWIR